MCELEIECLQNYSQFFENRSSIRKIFQANGQWHLLTHKKCICFWPKVKILYKPLGRNLSFKF